MRLASTLHHRALMGLAAIALLAMAVLAFNLRSSPAHASAPAAGSATCTNQMTDTGPDKLGTETDAADTGRETADTGADAKDTSDNAGARADTDNVDLQCGDQSQSDGPDTTSGPSGTNTDAPTGTSPVK